MKLNFSFLLVLLLAQAQAGVVVIKDVTLDPPITNLLTFEDSTTAFGYANAYGSIGGAQRGAMYRSTDSGKSWHTLNATALADRIVYRPVIHTRNAKNIWVFYTTKISFSLGEQVYLYSSDGGDTFIPWTFPADWLSPKEVQDGTPYSPSQMILHPTLDDVLLVSRSSAGLFAVKGNVVTRVTNVDDRYPPTFLQPTWCNSGEILFTRNQTMLHRYDKVAVGGTPTTASNVWYDHRPVPDGIEMMTFNMDENFVVYTARDGRKLRIFVDKGCSGTFTEIATPPELAAFDASAANIGAEVCTAPPAATCAYTTPVQIMLIDKRIVVGVVLRKSTSSANSNNWNRLIMVSNAAGTTLTAVTMRPFFTFGSQSLYATMVDARFQFWSPVSGLWFATVLSPDTRGSDTVTQEPVITMRSVDYGLSWHYLDDTKLFTSCRFNPCGVYLLPHSAVARDGTSLLLTKATDNAVFKDYDLSWSTDKGQSLDQVSDSDYIGVIGRNFTLVLAGNDPVPHGSTRSLRWGSGNTSPPTHSMQLDSVRSRSDAVFLSGMTRDGVVFVQYEADTSRNEPANMLYVEVHPDPPTTVPPTTVAPPTTTTQTPAPTPRPIEATTTATGTNAVVATTVLGSTNHSTLPTSDDDATGTRASTTGGSLVSNPTSSSGATISTVETTDASLMTPSFILTLTMLFVQ